ncbi:MAG TPA: conjugal transfer protein [Solirubrobacterales bacterium]|nr:conjugal transfer protein [Solirubrobacterales bacterium]
MERRTLGAALRSVGRVALWTLVALLLAKGGAAVLAGPSRRVAGSASQHGAAADPASGAFAVRFARTYLSGSSRELTPLLAPGVGDETTPGATGTDVPVEQAEVAGARDLGGGRAIVTVACELGGGRTLYLAVPIVREGAGEVAALGAPAVVTGPPGVAQSPTQPGPLAGSSGAAIADLVRRFLPAYLSASEPGDLSYLLAPGARVTPLGGALRLLAVGAVKQEGDSEGPRRTAIATARVRESGGATLRLAYRIEVVRRGRWYVDGVEGALS